MQIIFVAQKSYIAQIQARPLSCTVAQLRRNLIGLLDDIGLQNLLLIGEEIFLRRTAQPNVKLILTQVIKPLLLRTGREVADFHLYACRLAIVFGKQLG